MLTAFLAFEAFSLSRVPMCGGQVENEHINHLGIRRDNALIGIRAVHSDRGIRIQDVSRSQDY